MTIGAQMPPVRGEAGEAERMAAQGAPPQEQVEETEHDEQPHEPFPAAPLPDAS